MNVLITGAGGMLARALQQALKDERVHAFDRAALDVTDASAVREAITRIQPAVVIQCAAYTRVDDAEAEPELAFQVNAESTSHVAAACRETGARLVYPSTDYVFNGNATEPYPIDAPIDPVNTYGRSKAAGEEAARGAGDYLIVRTSWLYGSGGRNFVRTIVDRIRSGQSLRVVSDQIGSPTWTADLAAAIVGLLRAPAGVYHASNSGTTSWHDFACAISEESGLPGDITPCASADHPTRARRPRYSVLDCHVTSSFIGPLRPWKDALRQAIQQSSY